MKFRFFAVTLAILFLGACATVKNGSTDLFVVETTPPGATVKTTNQFECELTPCSFKISRKHDFDVTVSKIGYKSSTHRITSSGPAIERNSIGQSMLVGGIIGVGVSLGVDALTGATKDLMPNPLIIIMEREDGVVTAAPAQPVS